MTGPHSGLLLRSVWKEQQQAIWTLRRLSNPPLRRNNNNQPESATPCYSSSMERQQQIEMILRTVA